MALLTERYAEKIEGVLGCYDRVMIQGTLPNFCYAEGMTTYFYANKIRIFDYPRFAEPLRDKLRENAEALAKANSLTIEFVKNHIRKEDKIRAILKTRGSHPGLVAILSAMEICQTYKPWHDKTTGKTFLKPDDAKCLHYYFYFIDAELGLCFVRVPTWCPFRLQVYFNGHHWLASELTKRKIGFKLMDNAFSQIDDWAKAQTISDELQVSKLHAHLDRFAERYCPVIREFGFRYHWSLMQVEYATDVVFSRQNDLREIYGALTRTAIHAVKPVNVATFLGRKLDDRYPDELGNDFHTRIEGTRIKHHMGPVSIKMYDKFGLILRIETTVNDVSFFKHYREVEQRDGTRTTKWAPMKKGIYSLAPLRELLGAANRRYLDFISTLDDPTDGMAVLHKISKPVVKNERVHSGFNFFDDEDQRLFEALLRGEFNISGFQNKNLRRCLPNKTCGQMSRLLKSLRLHGIIRKVGKTYKYYLTKLGRHVLAAGLKLKEFVLIPQLARAIAT